MLDFAPMNTTATVYKQDTSKADTWGQPLFKKSATVKCRIDYNTNFRKISGNDGWQEIVSATILMHGEVDVAVGDKVIIPIKAIITEYIVMDAYPMQDLSGKIISTKVVVGSGKRA